MHETDTSYGTGPGADTGGVKERVTDTASQVGDAGRETARDAKEKAHDVAHEASERARGLIGRTRIELKAQAETQQQRLAGGLRSLGDEMDQMANGSQDPGYATELIRHAGDATGQAARWFDEHEPESILREVEDFARRRPGMFIAMAAGAGLLVGRFLRSMKDAPDDGEASRGTQDHGRGRASDQVGTEPTPHPAATRSPTQSQAPTPAAMPSPSAGGAPTFPPPTPSTGGDPYVERT